MKCSYCREEYESSKYRDACVKCGAPRDLIVPSGDMKYDGQERVLLRSNIDSVFADLDGGYEIDTILCDVWALRKINDFYDGFVQTARWEGALIKELMHPITGRTMKVIPQKESGIYFMGNGNCYAEINNYSHSC